MSRRSADIVQLRIEPSAWLAAAVAAGHCAAFLGGVTAAGRAWAPVLVCVIGVSLVHTLRRDALRCAPGAIRRIVFGAGPECLVGRSTGGPGSPARALATVVTGAVIILRLEFDGGRAEYLVVCADAVPADGFRRLRARCRLSLAAD